MSIEEEKSTFKEEYSKQFKEEQAGKKPKAAKEEKQHTPTYPDTHTYTNDYVSNNIPEMTRTTPSGEYIKKEHIVPGGGKGKYKIDCPLIISVSENTPESLRQITPFDVAMLQCVCSLWENGNTIIYPELLYSQWTNGKRPGKSILEKINDSIKALSSVKIEYDYTPVIKRNNPDFNGTASAKETLLCLRELKIKAGGHTMKAYEIAHEPAILTSARLLNQIITVKREYLTVNDVSHKKVWNDNKAEYEIQKKLLDSEARMSADRALIRDYLLRRIYEYKNYNSKRRKQKREINKIKLETLFTTLEIVSKDSRYNAKEFIIDCMDNFELKGIIKSYETEMSNGLKSITFKL